MARNLLTVFCNPLLDASIWVDDEFLQQHSLKVNDQILALTEAHRDLIKQVFTTALEQQQKSQNHTDINPSKKETVVLSAGGAGQNTARAAQWLLPQGGVVYSGAVGKDSLGQMLRSVAEDEGVQVRYYEVPDETMPTGTCLCLLSQEGKARSLVASLDAACHFHQSHLDSDSALKAALESTAILYVTGFFLSSSVETVRRLFITDKTYKMTAMNLSAPFVIDLLLTGNLEVLKGVDILFGNRDELDAWCSARKCIENGISTGQLMTPGEADLMTFVRRALVITDGSRPTTIVLRTHKNNDSEIDVLEKFIVQVDSLPSECIVDTTGAGNAFVGGFLAHLLKLSNESCANDVALDKDFLEDACRVGHALARHVIQELGVHFPQQLKPSSISAFLYT